MNRTKEQEENLEKLVSHLESLPDDYKDFDMETYIDFPGYPMDQIDIFYYVTDKNQHCGTVACVIGHGPVAGIKGLPDEPWIFYSERVFGLRSDSDAWDYLFSSDWSDHDNTLKGAIQRIRKFQDNNWQDEWNIMKEKFGDGNVDS